MTNKKVMSSNPTQIPWPTDQWGFTRELKKAITTACSRLNGAPDKKEVLDATLQVALGFIEVSFKSSQKERTEAMKRLEKLSATSADAHKAPAKKAPAKAEADVERDLFSVDE